MRILYQEFTIFFFLISVLFTKYNIILYKYNKFLLFKLFILFKCTCIVLEKYYSDTQIGSNFFVFGH